MGRIKTLIKLAPVIYKGYKEFKKYQSRRPR